MVDDTLRILLEKYIRGGFPSEMENRFVQRIRTVKVQYWVIQNLYGPSRS